MIPIFFDSETAKNILQYMKKNRLLTIFNMITYESKMVFKSSEKKFEQFSIIS